MFAYSPPVALDKFSTFGDLLRYLRRRMGLTQGELSIAVGYSDTQISRLEQNLRLPDLPTVAARFVSALGIEDEPEVVARLMELAATARREDAPASGLPPFKGLQYFDEADADLFFGREAVVLRLLKRITSSAGPASDLRFLAVVGASGSGKSSIVRAGLVPALRWQPSSADWSCHILTPTARPLEALALSLAGQEGSLSAAAALAGDLAREPRTLHLAARSLLGQASASRGATSPLPARLLLVVDQLEELFTLCRDEDERRAFVENLLTACSLAGGAVFVVLTLRADFYARCAPYAGLRAALAGQQEYIGPMSADELRQAIEAPARHGGWELEPGLVELLLHDVGAGEHHLPEPGALPLLSHALLETWRRRRRRLLTISGYLASGSVHGAIAETAEAVFHDQLDAQQQRIARSIFLRLTEPGESQAVADTRRRVLAAELVLRPEDAPAIRAVLTALADARLITTEQEAVEVAHEALIREWPTLRGWLEESRDGLRLQHRLSEAAHEWEQQRRDPGELYRGARLAQALEWVEVHADELNPLEREFLRASRARAEAEAAEREAQRQRELEAARRLAEAERQRAEEHSRAAARQAQIARQLRWRAVLLGSALLVAAVLAVAALAFGGRASQNARQAAQERQVATSRELAAAAISELEVDPERSLLLALYGLGASYTPQAEDALHRAVRASRVRLNLSGQAAAVSTLAYSPDGRWIASGSGDGSVTIWDAATGAEWLELTARGSAVNQLAYSPNGQTLAVVGDSGTITLWEAASGKELLSIPSGQRATISLAFSPDGKRLATGAGDGSFKVWDLASGREVLFRKGHADGVFALAFSPVDNRLASAGWDARLIVWDAASGEELAVFEGEYGLIGFSPLEGGSQLAVTIPGGMAMLDADTGEVLLSGTGHVNLVYGGALSRDGTRVATFSLDRRAKVWDAATGDLLVTLAGHEDGIQAAAFSPDGTRLATGSADRTVRVWDLAMSREAVAIPIYDGSGRAVFSPDGRLIAASDGFTPMIWDAATGELLRTLEGHSGFVTNVAFSNDGRLLVSASEDATAILWEVATGRLLHRLEGHVGWVLGPAFSPDGALVATTSDDHKVILWDAATGRKIRELPGHTEPSLRAAFSPLDGGSLLATGGVDHVARIWNPATGEQVALLEGHTNNVWGVDFSPDGRLLATSSSDGKVRLWDTQSWQDLRTLSGHSNVVVTVVFSPDGTKLATASRDGTARIWGVDTGDVLLTFYGEPGIWLHGVDFSPDGKWLVTGGKDGLRTFALQLEDLAALARSRLTRSLTAAECRQYLHLAECPPAP